MICKTIVLAQAHLGFEAAVLCAAVEAGKDGGGRWNKMCSCVRSCAAAPDGGVLEHVGGTMDCMPAAEIRVSPTGMDGK